MGYFIAVVAGMVVGGVIVGVFYNSLVSTYEHTEADLKAELAKLKSKLP